MAVTGMIVCKILHIKDDFLNKNGILIFPGIGIVFLINAVQMWNLFLPIRWLVYPYLVFMVWGIANYGKWMKCCLQTFLCGKCFLAVLAGVSLIWMLPFLGKNELVSVQVWNNDIIYYLSSMEWLKMHPSTQPVVYDSNHPFFWCAEYMLNRTRIGFDGYGAFMMSLFGRKAHEVFSCLGVVMGLTLLFHVYYLLSTVCKVPKGIRVAVVILAALAGRIEELLIYQYIPQLCGISLFLLFLALLYIFLEGQELRHGVTALVISGIIAVYAEFCAYLLVAFLGFTAIAYAQGKKETLKKGWLEGVMAILMNPAGTFRAIKINLFVLSNTGDRLDNIDPFYGDISSVLDAAAQLFGVCEISGISGWAGILYQVIWGLVLAGILFIWEYYLIKIKDAVKKNLIFLVVFWWIYEMYFRWIRYGYGEYKHLISFTVAMIVFSGYVGFRFLSERSDLKAAKALCGIIGIFGIICGSCKLYGNLVQRQIFFWDDSLMEVAEAGKLVPWDEPIGLSGNAAAIHGEVYALREHAAAILSNYISYYPYSEEASCKYQLYEKTGKNLEDAEGQRIVWENGRFCLVEHTNLQITFYTGFHLENLEDAEKAVYTCDRESSIVIQNFTEKEKCFSVAFQSEKINDTPGTIDIMASGEVIAQGKVGDYIVTDMMLLNPGESIRIYLYFDGELAEINGSVEGLGIHGIKTIVYDEA